jgi:TonB family protein
MRRIFALAVFGCAAATAGSALADEPSPAPAAPTDATPALIPAEIVTRVDPDYPPSRLQEVHGQGDALPDVDVEVEAAIDETGAVTGVKVISSGGPEFDEQATSAVKGWTFKPATLDGKAVASRLHIPLHFEPPPHPEPQPIDVSVSSRRPPPTRGGGDYRITVGQLDAVPHPTAGQLLQLAPSVFLSKDGGGDGHADGIFMRGFDAGDGEGVELSTNGVPINEAGNYHANGYGDLNFIIPELVLGLRVLEGPFDPRQGNFAVAGSADYDLGLAKRGLTAKVTYGAFNTSRLLLMWGPEGESQRTFAGADISHTDGFGQNRESMHARAIGQYEGRLGDSGSFRVTSAASFTSYRAAGLVRQDDVDSGKLGFYDTYDTKQGGSSARVQTAVDFETKHDKTVFGVQAFGAYTNLRIRENPTGFIEDEQLPQESPHGQRGDLIDLSNTGGMFGARAFGRQGFELFGRNQEAELGLFARGDVVGATQQRDLADTGVPYKTEADIGSKLGDVGLYADLSMHLLDWLTVRGGTRVELLAYDIDDHCAVHEVENASTPDDASCLTSQPSGAHREPNQRASTAAARPMPRVSLLFGPFEGFSFTASYGQGIRSIDPASIVADQETAYAAIDAFETGASYAKSFDALALKAESVFFVTHLDHDQLASETEGRDILTSSTLRGGWAGSVRATGDFFDIGMSLSFVKGRFDDGSPLPYVPDVVFRHDGALFHDLFDLDDAPVKGRVGVGVGVVGPRELLFGEHSDTIVNLDAGTSLAWRFLELEVQGTNLLNLETKQAEFDYASNFDPALPASPTPVRHFAAAAPLGIFVSLSGTLGGAE